MQFTVLQEDKHAIFSKVPDYIKKRLIRQRKEFSELGDALILFCQGNTDKKYKEKEFVKILETNKCSILTQERFKVNPKIHWAYYDEIVDNIIMVKDIKGNLIPKELTYMTTCGGFIKYSDIFDNQVKIIKRSDTFVLDKESIHGKYAFIKDTSYVHKVDKDKCLLSLTLRTLTSLIHSSMDQVCRNVNPYEFFKNESSFQRENFDRLFHKMFNDQDSFDFFYEQAKVCIQVSDTENIVNRYHTLACPNRGFMSGVYLDVSKACTNFLCYFDNNGVITTHSELDNQRGFMNARSMGYLEQDFPYNIYIQKAELGKLEKNAKTRNNNGSSENYNARVPDYKVSFLMTADEEKLYKDNNSNTPVFMGVELEYNIIKDPKSDYSKEQLNQSLIKEIAESPLGDHVIMKSDSSIGDIGFEMVTIPATLAYHKYMLEEHFFKPGFNTRVIAGSKKCGLHVHIGKQAFSSNTKKIEASALDKKFNQVKKSTNESLKSIGKQHINKSSPEEKTFSKMAIGKFIVFLSSQANSSFVYDLAGREPTEYCAPNRMAKGLNSCGVHEGIKIGKHVSFKNPDGNANRRVIVNTANRDTVEVRLFWSTNDRNSLFRRLEFCKALVGFVKQASCKQLTVYHFLKYILEKDNRKEYPNLLIWCASKDYIGMQKVHVKEKGKPPRYVKRYGPVKIPDPTSSFKNTLIKPNQQPVKVEVDKPATWLNQTQTFVNPIPIQYVSDGYIYDPLANSLRRRT